ncbi:MAG: heparinase II/III-family protein [Rubritepida sp.]|nr:heparinase II/III-family protein [Rubritepida sp.]
MPAAAWLLTLDAAWRLGPRPVALAVAGRGPWARRRLQRALPGISLADPMAGEDLRPLWEAHRWAELPALALAGEGARIAPFVEAWMAAHPPFAGPLWLCGQEAALRALHLVLAGALAGQAPPRAVLTALARRIAANPAYALAQDNNHPISEAAGLMACGLALGDGAMAARGARRFDRVIARLVAPDGSFAQPSPAYHRLMLDVAAVLEWLRMRHRAPALDPVTRGRLDAATQWLYRLTCPETGALPRIGHQDGSCFADLSGAGPDDARASLERAARLFSDSSAGFVEDPGCAALGLPCPQSRLYGEPAWETRGFLGRQGEGARAVLRTGPLRFRPGHADLLHLDLWDGTLNLLRDAGSYAYNPRDRGRAAAFQATAAHNTIAFDGEDQMPRLGPFLFARWPRTGALPDGGWVRDWRGRRHARAIAAKGRLWRVTDEVSGPFREGVLRWRLAPGAWRLTAEGAEGTAARLRVTANGPLRLDLVAGEESLAYGAASPLPVLEVAFGPEISRLETEIRLA